MRHLQFCAFPKKSLSRVEEIYSFQDNKCNGFSIASMLRGGKVALAAGVVTEENLMKETERKWFLFNPRLEEDK